jgi:hypothetical protein
MDIRMVYPKVLTSAVQRGLETLVRVESAKRLAALGK